MRPLLRTALALAGLAAGAGLGCEDPQHFSEPEKHSLSVVDFEDVVMNGRRLGSRLLPPDPQFIYRFNVQPEPDMVHPHLIGRWTLTDPEKPIDVYVIPATNFVDSLPPTAYPDSLVFWKSTTDATTGQQRATSMQEHPFPGDWVVLFYNTAENNLGGRSEISSEVTLTWFK